MTDDEILLMAAQVIRQQCVSEMTNQDWIAFARAIEQRTLTNEKARWRKKGGVQDIMKAIHFLEKLVEVENDRLQRTHTRNPEASEGVPQTAIEASVSGRFDYSRAFTSGSKTTLECNQGGFTPRSLGDII